MGFDGRKPGDNPALDEIEHLRAELAAERERSVIQQSSLDMLCKEIDESEARIAKLREALELFALAADAAVGDDSDVAGIGLTKGDLRRARAAYEETMGDGDE